MAFCSSDRKSTYCSIKLSSYLLADSRVTEIIVDTSSGFIVTCLLNAILLTFLLEFNIIGYLTSKVASFSFAELDLLPRCKQVGLCYTLLVHLLP